MNIGIFTDTYYPQINGVVTSVRMLEKELTKLGHKVIIFTTSNPNFAEPLPRVFRLPSMPFIFLKSHRVAFMYSPKLIIKTKKFKLDIIHTQTEFSLGIFGKVASEFLRIPSVHTYHTMYEDYVHYIANGHLISKKTARRFSRIFCNRADTVIAPVQKTKDCLLKYGVIRPITVIPTGIDFSPFARGRFSESKLAQTRAELGLKPGTPTIVFVGRIAKEKSIDVIISAMPELISKLPSAKLLIIGGGPYLKEITELAHSLKLNDSVIFGGEKPWDMIGLYYQIGDVFVTASTSETQGLTYIEAMAAHVPVIAKKDGSNESILKHGVTGYSFQNDSELPTLLYRALTNKEEASAMTVAAYEGIKDLSAAHFAKSLEKLYSDVLNNYTHKKKKRHIVSDYNVSAKSD